MGLFRDVGHWAVTTADDAHGEANGLDPADAKPEDPVWAVYDPNEDDEPVAENLTHFWAMRVATALHLMDVVAPVLGALESEPMPAQPDPYDEVGAKGYFVVCCKACDSGRVAPVPFANEESRTGWIREHTLGTGHTHYHLVNPTPHQAKIVAVDAPPNILPPGFALAGEVSLGAITAGPSVTGIAEPMVLRGPARLQMLDDDGRPFGPSIPIADSVMEVGNPSESRSIHYGPEIPKLKDEDWVTTSPHPYQGADINLGYDLPCCKEPPEAEIHRVEP